MCWSETFFNYHQFQKVEPQSLFFVLIRNYGESLIHLFVIFKRSIEPRTMIIWKSSTQSAAALLTSFILTDCHSVLVNKGKRLFKMKRRLFRTFFHIMLMLILLIIKNLPNLMESNLPLMQKQKARIYLFKTWSNLVYHLRRFCLKLVHA